MNQARILTMQRMEEMAARYRAEEAARCEIRATCPTCQENVPAHYIRTDILACEYCEEEHDYDRPCSCDDCKAAATWELQHPNVSDIPFAEVSITPEQHANLIARVRGDADMDSDGGFVTHSMWAKVRCKYTGNANCVSTAVVALALFAAITAPHGCTITGTTGQDEAFPLAHCADGSFVYSDLDGDGLGASTTGRWLDASGYVPMG